MWDERVDLGISNETQKEQIIIDLDQDNQEIPIWYYFNFNGKPNLELELDEEAKILTAIFSSEKVDIIFQKKVEDIKYDSLRKKFSNLAIKNFFFYYWIFEVSLSTNNEIKEILKN